MMFAVLTATSPTRNSRAREAMMNGRALPCLPFLIGAGEFSHNEKRLRWRGSIGQSSPSSVPPHDAKTITLTLRRLRESRGIKVVGSGNGLDFYYDNSRVRPTHALSRFYSSSAELELPLSMLCVMRWRGSEPCS